MGRKVLVIDLDSQCNATSGFGVSVEKGRSIYGMIMMKKEDVYEFIYRTCTDGVDIIPSEVDLAGVEVELSNSEEYPGNLKQCMKRIIDDKIYDYIFLDCPPSLGIMTINALATAEWVVIPIQCEYYALEGLSIITRVVNRICTTGVNPSLKILGIVLTMFDCRTRLASDVLNEVKKHFSSQLFNTVIPRNVRISEAPSYGLPVIEYAPSSAGANAYLALAEEVDRRVRSSEDLRAIF